ncbi:calcium/sodium antiporter [Gemmatimonadota bacterium]
MVDLGGFRFDDLPLWASWLAAAISVLLIGKGAQQVVEAAARIAKRLRISELIVGLTLVAAATSLPELGVTLVAAFEEHPNISVGTIVGSNMFNLGFILGGIAVIRPIPTTRMLVRRDGSALILATFLLLALIARDFRLDRIDGAILLAGMGVYLAVVVAIGRIQWLEPGLALALPGRGINSGDTLKALKTLSGLALGIVLLAVGSHLLVNSAIPIARSFGVSHWVIGVTVVASGTSAPEFATSLVGVLRGRYDMSVGNVIGSDLFNLLGVLGVAGVLHPQAVVPGASASLIALAVMVVLVVVFARTGWRLSRTEGLALVLFGLARWTLDFAGHGVT